MKLKEWRTPTNLRMQTPYGVVLAAVDHFTVSAPSANCLVTIYYVSASRIYIGLGHFLEH